jgi:integrase
VKGSIKRRCYCKGDDGRVLWPNCPDLDNGKHGVWEYRDRLLTSAGRKAYRNSGHRTRKSAEAWRDHVHALVALSKGDESTAAKIGDLIFRAKRGAQLPDVEDVRRRLGIGHTLDRSQTVREWLETWWAAKKRAKRDSTLRGYRQHLDLYLIPQLGEWPIDRLNALHIADLFDLIDEWNAEIEAAAQEGRSPVLDGDVRQHSQVVGVATQRRIFATLRNALNVAMKQKPVRLLDFNPCDLVELEAEHREPARTWDPGQVGRFLEYAERDPLYLLYRLVLLFGPRRGEAVGARWTGYDYDKRSLRVIRPLLQLGGKLVESTPKTRAGERVVFMDEDTNEGVKRLRVQQARNRLAFGEAYEDNDLIWCREDGSPYSPEYVSRHFKDLARSAGLPPIKLHEGRHTAATLRLEAGVDTKIVSEQLGHSNTNITQNLYQHVRRAVLDQATDAVVRLLPERKRPAAEDTGS